MYRYLEDSKLLHWPFYHFGLSFQGSRPNNNKKSILNFLIQGLANYLVVFKL